MSTIRVQNIPLTTSKDHVKQHFTTSSTVVARCSLEPSHDDRSKQVATVTFNKNKMLKAALHADNAIMMSNITSESGTPRIEIDNHFRGFTVVAGGLNHEIDIIALHGLNGHAFNTWTREHPSVPGGVMWLRDLLPDQVKNARVTIYGYNSSLVSDASVSRIQEHARLFVQSLQDFKRNDKRRVILIGHSLGGIVIKQQGTGVH